MKYHDEGYLFEQDYILQLSVDIAKEVGFKIFNIDIFRDVIVGAEEIGSNKEVLKEISDNLRAIRRKTTDEYLLIYCLCTKLRDLGYKAELTYALVSKVLYMEPNTVRTRYFEQKKKYKHVDTQNLIKTHDLEFRINRGDRKNKLAINPD